MTIYEYMGIECSFPSHDRCAEPELRCVECREKHHPFDGNLMVAAINKMESIVDEDGVSNLVDFENYAVNQIDRNETYYTVWLFGSPETFFRLMGECLDKHIIGGK